MLLYIFGGAFKSGKPSDFGPEFIMNKNIILVMVNYRLGALGFLSTGDSVIPGNMAMKDQTMAMKWTRNNIFNFGGDSSRITIHGHSSGSACVHLHTLSPLSRGMGIAAYLIVLQPCTSTFQSSLCNTDYFDRAIMQSGLGVNPQFFWDRDNAMGIARAFAQRLNCSTDSSNLLKECLQSKTASELVFAAEDVHVG